MKSKLQFFFLFLGFSLSSIVVNAQLNVRDSSVRLTLLSVHIARFVPGGDMVERFGSNNVLGASFGIKTKSNIIFSIDANYLFSDQVKNQDYYFHGVKNKNGYVIDANGMFAEIFLYERGFSLNGSVAKLFPVLGPNPNSGPFISFGMGYLSHHVRIENLNNVALQVTGDYAKYYDKLTAGLNLVEMVGYRFTSNNRLLNFYAAFEFNQAFTHSHRSYNLDDYGNDPSRRVDLLSGLRFGWVFPIYRRPPRDFYYF